MGSTTAITDAVKMCQKNPELWDKILDLIGRLGWNGNDNKGVYSSYNIRTLRNLYAKYADREKDMENVLLTACSGSEYYHNNLMPLAQRQRFDYLNQIISTRLENIDFLTQSKRKAKTA